MSRVTSPLADFIQKSAIRSELPAGMQIDEMVYKLYDLTPEEIAIVEGKRVKYL